MPRFSTQREIVSQIIIGEGKHMTAEEVTAKAKKINPKIGIATVYRNLNSLAEEGKIARHRDQDQGYVYDGNPEPHYHYECNVCGSIYDLPIKYNEQLDQLVQSELGLNVSKHMTTFTGQCNKCMDNQ